MHPDSGTHGTYETARRRGESGGGGGGGVEAAVAAAELFNTSVRWFGIRARVCSVHTIIEKKDCDEK
jgi:hypothetical protein